MARVHRFSQIRPWNSGRNELAGPTKDGSVAKSLSARRRCSDPRNQHHLERVQSVRNGTEQNHSMCLTIIIRRFNANILQGRKFLQEKSPAFVTARSSAV